MLLRTETKRWYYVIYRFPPDEKATATIRGASLECVMKGEQFVDMSAESGKRYVYYVTAVDRLHNEGRPIGPLKVEVHDQKLVRF
jgi:hypothetical protein